MEAIAIMNLNGPYENGIRNTPDNPGCSFNGDGKAFQHNAETGFPFPAHHYTLGYDGLVRISLV